MAKKLITTLIDDLTHEPIDDGKGETVLFSIDGTEYEIDLSEEHAAELRQALKPYIDAARSVGSQRSRRTSTSTRSSGRSSSKTKEIRAWALANGIAVSSRGRISEEVIKAYESAH